MEAVRCSVLVSRYFDDIVKNYSNKVFLQDTVGLVFAGHDVLSCATLYCLLCHCFICYTRLSCF